MKMTLIYLDLFLRMLRIIAPIAYTMSAIEFYRDHYDKGLIFLCLGMLCFQIHPVWFTLGSIGNTLAWIDKGCPNPTFYEVEEKPTNNKDDQGK